MQKSFRFTFGKAERLCSKKLAEELFLSKQTQQFFQYPLKASCLFTVTDSDSPVQVVFPVAKRSFKRAHDRNGIRRLLRESYRLQKNFLYKELLIHQTSCVLAISYIAKEKVPYRDIYNATTILIQSIAKTASKHSNIYPAEPDAGV